MRQILLDSLPRFLVVTLLFFLSQVHERSEAAQSRGSSQRAGQEARERSRNPVVELKQDVGALEAQALEAEKAHKWPEAAMAYLKASALTRTHGEYKKAVDFGQRALRASENGNLDAMKVRTLLSLSRSYRLLRQEDKAGEVLLAAQQAAKQINQPRRQEVMAAAVARELGYHYLNQRETEKAIDYISAALKTHESALATLQSSTRRPGIDARARKLEGMIVVALLRLGSAQREAGRFADAEKSFSRGLDLLQRSGTKSGSTGKFFQELGELYLARKDYSRAMEFFDKVLRDTPAGSGTPQILRAAGEMGHTLLAAGKPSEAIPQFKRAIDGVESIRAALESEELRTAFFENKRGLYTGMINAQLATGQIDEGFNYNERARSRAFLDMLGNQVELARNRGLREEERALQARLRALEAKTVSGDGDDEDDSEEQPVKDNDVAPNIADAQKAYDDFLAKVRKQNKEQASLMSVEPLTLKQIQQMLDPGVTLLEYFVAGDQTLLWVVEKDSVHVVTISLWRRDLVAKVRNLRQLITQRSRDGDGLKNSAQELYQLLIEPARPHISGKELLIVPHDVLHYLPFQALLAPDGRFLIEAYPIEYLSSASLMQFTKEKKQARRETALALGNPNLGDEAFNLRFAEREAREISQVYPKSAVLLRDQATKAKAVSLSPSNDVLHFAVHAEFNQDDPTSSALLLAHQGSEDGKLRVSEIFSLSLKADLVVLSACETGLGKISNGDEIVGLTRAFIYAGTPSVITTLWKVNDESSYELMHSFYTNLKTMTKSEALRQAQLKTMKEFPQPFYWAAYTLNGEP